MLESIGLTEAEIVCSSIPGYGIPLGRNIYDWLASQFNDHDLYVLFVFSQNYFKSVACLNEMGAAWVSRKECYSILLPGFEYSDIKGAINPNQISIKLDEQSDYLKQHLNELKDIFVHAFGLHMPSAAKWERLRDGFILKLGGISPNNNQNDTEGSSYAYSVLEKIRDHVNSLKSHMIQFQSGILKDYNRAFQSFFMLAGDLQLTFLDYEKYMIDYELTHPNFFRVTDLRAIIDTVMKMGFAMRDSATDGSKVSEFANHFNHVRDSCQQVIQTYNQTLSKR